MTLNLGLSPVPRGKKLEFCLIVYLGCLKLGLLFANIDIQGTVLEINNHYQGKQTKTVISWPKLEEKKRSIGGIIDQPPKGRGLLRP